MSSPEPVAAASGSASPLAAVASGVLSPPASTRLRGDVFLVPGLDAPVYVHSLDMGRSVLVWCGLGPSDGSGSGPAAFSLDDLVAAVPPSSSSPPSSGGVSGAPPACSCLISGPTSTADRDEVESFGRQLARRVGKLVLLAWTVPTGAAADAAAAARAAEAVMAAGGDLGDLVDEPVAVTVQKGIMAHLLGEGAGGKGAR
jgi:hypothetical protein